MLRAVPATIFMAASTSLAVFYAGWREKTFWQSAIFFFMLAISIDGLFLHAWADSVTSLTAFTLLAIGNTVLEDVQQTKKLKTED